MVRFLRTSYSLAVSDAEVGALLEETVPKVWVLRRFDLKAIFLGLHLYTNVPYKPGFNQDVCHFLVVRDDSKV